MHEQMLLASPLQSDEACDAPQRGLQAWKRLHSASLPQCNADQEALGEMLALGLPHLLDHEEGRSDCEGNARWLGRRELDQH